MANDDIFNKPLKKTGVEIPDGNYPVTLIGYSEPFILEVADEYKKKGKPTERQVFDMKFAVRVKSSKGPETHLVKYLVPVPANGMSSVKSNLYKCLKAIGANFFDKEGSFKDAVTLKSFVGANGVAQIELNAKGFNKIAAVTGPIEGLSYPIEVDYKNLIDEMDGDGTAPF